MAGLYLSDDDDLLRPRRSLFRRSREALRKTSEWVHSGNDSDTLEEELRAASAYLRKAKGKAAAATGSPLRNDSPVMETASKLTRSAAARVIASETQAKLDIGEHVRDLVDYQKEVLLSKEDEIVQIAQNVEESILDLQAAKKAELASLHRRIDKLKAGFDEDIHALEVEFLAKVDAHCERLDRDVKTELRVSQDSLLKRARGTLAATVATNEVIEESSRRSRSRSPIKEAVQAGGSSSVLGDDGPLVMDQLSRESLGSVSALDADRQRLLDSIRKHSKKLSHYERFVDRAEAAGARPRKLNMETRDPSPARHNRGGTARTSVSPDPYTVMGKVYQDAKEKVSEGQESPLAKQLRESRMAMEQLRRGRKARSAAMKAEAESTSGEEQTLLAQIEARRRARAIRQLRSKYDDDA